jgi:two-component system, NarL family, sensor kinase
MHEVKDHYELLDVDRGFGREQEPAERVQTVDGRLGGRARPPRQVGQRLARRPRSLDRERAGHAGRLVAVEGAVELVLALLEARADGRGAAWAHDLAVLVDAIALDGDAVLKTGRGGVLHDQRHLALLGGELVGRRFELGPAEKAAVRKRVVDAEVSDVSRPENVYERRFGKLLEVYLPIEAPTGTELLFEDYLRYSLVTDSEHRQLARFAPALIGALLVLWLVQLPLAASLARRLRQRQLEREALLQRAIDSSDAERLRVAQYLHDGVVQELSGVSYSLAAAANRLEREGNERAWRSVHSATAATRRAIAELRALLFGIYPASVRRSGLAAALLDLVAPLTARDIAVDLDVPPGLNLPPATEETLFRGAQEALRNAERHAAPDHIEVHVGVKDWRATLTVSDDGAGFSPAERTHSVGRHFGPAAARRPGRGARWPARGELG